MIPEPGEIKGTRSKGIGFEEGTYQPECSLGTCFWIGHYPSNEGWRSLWKSMSFLGVFGIGGRGVEWKMGVRK